MKLMVVEMQQQLNELEDRERAEGGGDPKPPPRGREKGEYRVNPFNTGGEVFENLLKYDLKLNIVFCRKDGR